MKAKYTYVRILSNLLMNILFGKVRLASIDFSPADGDLFSSFNCQCSSIFMLY